MRSLLHFAALVIFTAYTTSASAQQQTGAPPGIAVPAPPPSADLPPDSSVVDAQSHSFRIRVVDGRNGALVQNAHVQIWYDEPAGQGYVLATDAHGMVLMPAPQGEPVRVLAKIINYVDCRKRDRNDPPEGYNIASIAKSGAMAENGCGRLATRTSPGELVLFVRPARWYEGLNSQH
jgi:hypothetical protein